MPKGFKYQTLQPWHYTLYRLSLSFFLRLTMPPLYFIYWDGCLLLSCPGPDDKLSAVSFLWDKVMALLLTGITTLWEKHPNGTEKYLLSASESLPIHVTKTHRRENTAWHTRKTPLGHPPVENRLCLLETMFTDGWGATELIIMSFLWRLIRFNKTLLSACQKNCEQKYLTLDLYGVNLNFCNTIIICWFNRKFKKWVRRRKRRNV